MPAELALVSGSTGGIGRAVCERLWMEGYSLLCLGRSLRALNDLRDWCVDAQVHDGQCVEMLPIVLEDTDGYWRIQTLITSLTKGDALPLALYAACHGAQPRIVPATHCTREDLRAVFEVDVIGTLWLAQLAARWMIQQRRGAMVFVSSLHARQTYPQRVPYAISKAAVCGLARALAVEWGGYGLNIASVLPWQVDGERTQRFIDDLHRDTGEDLRALYSQRSPQQRLITPAEVASTVLWLAQTSGINGAEIVLDGGVSSSMWYRGFGEPRT